MPWQGEELDLKAPPVDYCIFDIATPSTHVTEYDEDWASVSPSWASMTIVGRAPYEPEERSEGGRSRAKTCTWPVCGLADRMESVVVSGMLQQFDITTPRAADEYSEGVDWVQLARSEPISAKAPLHFKAPMIWVDDEPQSSHAGGQTPEVVPQLDSVEPRSSFEGGQTQDVVPQLDSVEPQSSLASRETHEVQPQLDSTQCQRHSPVGDGRSTDCFDFLCDLMQLWRATKATCRSR